MDHRRNPTRPWMRTVKAAMASNPTGPAPKPAWRAMERQTLPGSYASSSLRVMPELPPASFWNARRQHRVNWSVNKAVKLGLEVRDAETEIELAAWYKLYLLTMRHNAVPPRPYRLFKSVWSTLRPAGQMRLLLAGTEQRWPKETGGRLPSAAIRPDGLLCLYGLRAGRFLSSSPRHSSDRSDPERLQKRVSLV